MAAAQVAAAVGSSAVALPAALAVQTENVAAVASLAVAHSQEPVAHWADVTVDATAVVVVHADLEVLAAVLQDWWV